MLGHSLLRINNPLVYSPDGGVPGAGPEAAPVTGAAAPVRLFATPYTTEDSLGKYA